MKPFICFAFAIAAISNLSFAGSGNPSKTIFPANFSTSLKASGFLFEEPVAGVCACQVLRVAAKNEKETLIAVFAQAVNRGDLSFNFASALAVLEKEKKHLKDFFFIKIKTAENLAAATECSMLYKNIKIKYENIRKYDVLDAGALTNQLVDRK